MEQEPGPRGSPQLPQGPAEGRGLADEEPLAEMPNTESWGESFLLWHLGHAGFWLP